MSIMLIREIDVDAHRERKIKNIQIIKCFKYIKKNNKNILPILFFFPSYFEIFISTSSKLSMWIERSEKKKKD